MISQESGGHVIFIDDEEEVRLSIGQTLELEGFEVTALASAEAALEQISHNWPGVVITDVKMPRMDGFSLLRKVLEIDPDLPVVFITAHGDIPMAIKAIRGGAYDFVEKAADPEYLLEVVRRAIEKRRLVLENRALRIELESKSGLEARLIGRSPQVVELRNEVAKLADSKVDVLIYGETGVGKEVVARCLHDFGSRKKNHFVPVNCGGIPGTLFESELFGHEPGAFTDAKKRRIGRFEYAHNGTLFLDEIESMPIGMQVRLLRVLEERVIERLGSNEQIPVDFRVVTATKADLKEAVEKGEFREDLYFRLSVAEIRIPPLRERIEDIPLLFEFFVQQKAIYHDRPVPTLSRDDLNSLMAHRWQGNVRELVHVAERYVLGLGGENRGMPGLMDIAVKDPLTLSERVDSFEKCLIEQCLSESKGNVQATMKALGIPRRTLNEKMKKYGLDRTNYL